MNRGSVPPSCSPPPPGPKRAKLPSRSRAPKFWGVPGPPLKPCKIRENTWFLRYSRPPEPPWSLPPAPGGPQDAPKTKTRPRGPQEPPRRPPGAPKEALSGPRTRPRGPKRPQDAPKRPPRRHQKAQEAPKRRPEEPRPQAHGTTSLLALGGRRQEGVAP